MQFRRFDLNFAGNEGYELRNFTREKTLAAVREIISGKYENQLVILTHVYNLEYVREEEVLIWVETEDSKPELMTIT